MTGERWWLFYTGYPARAGVSGRCWSRPCFRREPRGTGSGRSLSQRRARWRCRTPRRWRSQGPRHVLRQRRRRSDPHRARDLIRRPVVGSPGHGPGTRGPRPRRLERAHSLRGEAADGSVGMWYAGLPIGDEELGYRICSARFPGPWVTKGAFRESAASALAPKPHLGEPDPARLRGKGWGWPVAPMMARAHDGSD